jgi:glycerate kinase
MAAACGGNMVFETVPDLFGREKRCGYADLGNGVAVIETAMAAGIADLKPEERDVLRASTYGVGFQIRRAIDLGYRKIIVGLGGSATNDGGLGALQALGVSFYDKSGNKIPDGAGGGILSQVFRAEKGSLKIPSDCEIVYACDVTNPYYGLSGAAHVYGPQKGADPETVLFLDEGLRSFAKVLAECFGRDVSEIPGAGAAGGLCGGLLAALGGTIRSGFDILAEASRLEEKIASADFVITGEGKTDGQTAFGKLPCRLGEMAKKHGVPAILISGSVGESAVDLYDHGITALFDTVPSPSSLEDVMQNAAKNLEFTAKNVGNLIAKFR